MANESQNKKGYERMNVRKFIDDYIYRIDLEADYQRDVIWSKKEQQELLDSILKGIDIPKIYLAELSDNAQFDFECIDGKQRMQTLLNFFKPDSEETKQLTLEFLDQNLTYIQLKEQYPEIAKRIENYELDFVTYKKEFLENDDSNFVRLIFRRLQLGKRLAAGEILHAHSGPVKDFIFSTVGKEGPFFVKTNLSNNRYSREFALSQICINSFSYNESREYARSRLDDIEDFFESNHKNLSENFSRIKAVLELMDKEFANAKIISSKAVAVSAYLFSEKLFLENKKELIAEFAKFYIKLLEEVKENSKLLRQLQPPKNKLIMEEFQKYISQASAERYSFKRRDDFLTKAFAYYLDPKTKGKIIG